MYPFDQSISHVIIVLCLCLIHSSSIHIHIHFPIHFHPSLLISRKLTPQEAAAKRERKIIGDKGGELSAILFRIESLRDAKQRFKVNVNATQYQLVGRVGRCSSENKYDMHSPISSFSYVVFDCAFRSMCDGLCGGNEKGYSKIREAVVAESQVE